ncbi:MAG: (d)CMP kinase [Candidatus Omnitrophica bacterium]|jgi:cytidylate kinase|nr:(d)CMP kinase [Candidatus Omnitrophota bacterium]MDD5079167.1 (d)CMP kinase [Candidatus Omnitrophota bacterium]
MIIAIDGPAGAGKSTVAKILAKKLGFLYLDTGAMYRALTFKALENKMDIGDHAGLAALAKNTSIDLIPGKDDRLTVLLDGNDVSLAIREPRITRHVSDVAKVKEVRQVLLELQRKLGSSRNSILDGRDIGTMVFPNAEKKFFIDAKIDERVNRRYKDLQNLNIQGVSREQVAGDLNNRDTIDSTREFAPLKKADDAIYIDTTNLSIDEVVQAMINHLQ